MVSLGVGGGKQTRITMLGTSAMLVHLYGLLIGVSCYNVAGANWSRVGEFINWESVDKILQQGIQKKVFPGCVAAVGDKDGFLFLSTPGNFTYGEPAPITNSNPPMTNNTLFDVASLTKVFVTTTAAMILYQKGQLDLDMKVSNPSLLGEEFTANGKENITVRNLLLHNAGFPPDPIPNYWYPEFGCPETAKYHPAEDFSCQEKIYASLMNQTLQNPPGRVYRYSDLSMITMMHVVGTLTRDLGYVEPSDLNSQCVHGEPQQAKTVKYYTQCYYEAFVRVHVLGYLGLTSTRFLPPPSLWGNCAPTWNDSTYRHEVMQGIVSDGNSYALGGIAGHAGLYTSVGDIFTLLHRLMFTGPSDPWINSSTVHTFTTVYNTSQSTRALGWDTNGQNGLCGHLSPTTYTHTGYTGTQVCNDPKRKVITILLTNRCYKNDTNDSKVQISELRKQFNTAVAEILGQQDGPQKYKLEKGLRIP